MDVSDQGILDTSMVRCILSWGAYYLLTGRLPSLEKLVAAVRRYLDLGYRVAQSEELLGFPERACSLGEVMIKGQSWIIVEPNGGARSVARHRSRAKFLSARNPTC
jgi:hypothetical protein